VSVHSATGNEFPKPSPPFPATHARTGMGARCLIGAVCLEEIGQLAASCGTDLCTHQQCGGHRRACLALSLCSQAGQCVVIWLSIARWLIPFLHPRMVPFEIGKAFVFFHVDFSIFWLPTRDASAALSQALSPEGNKKKATNGQKWATYYF